MNYQINKTKSYEINLVVTLDQEDLDYYLNEARKYLANNLKIEGFRPGKAPLEIAKDRLDKKEVLNTAFNSAFRQSFSDILMKEKIDLIDAGKFEIKENSPLRLIYSVSLTVFPEFKLAGYKNIRAKKNEVSVSEEEIDKTLEFIRDSNKQDGASLPELNDEFARSLGRFRDLKQLKESLGEGLKEEKEIKESQRIQAFVLDKIAEATKIEAPPSLIDGQLDQMILDLDADLHRNGMELGLFLAKNNKTRDELRNEWKSKAELLVKKALIMKKISKLENIKVDPEEVKLRVGQFFQNFSSPDGIEKNVDLQKLGGQIEEVLLNQKVLSFLEKEAIQN
ncbi:MAG: hypothetical protein HY451_01350 [Parcubacteria group bacterium]|nr:hypothetical protein [Parcubacteria group bacterium]